MRTPRYVGCFRSLRGRFVPLLPPPPPPGLPESSLELGDAALREVIELELSLQVQAPDDT
jgi:hypothetical protein